jgi:hypothetical protein
MVGGLHNERLQKRLIVRDEGIQGDPCEHRESALALDLKCLLQKVGFECVREPTGENADGEHGTPKTTVMRSATAACDSMRRGTHLGGGHIRNLSSSASR